MHVFVRSALVDEAARVLPVAYAIKGRCSAPKIANIAPFGHARAGIGTSNCAGGVRNHDDKNDVRQSAPTRSSKSTATCS